MLRTNSKKAKQNIHEYIIANADFSERDEFSFLYYPIYENADRWSMWKQAINAIVYDEIIKGDRRTNMTMKDFYREWLEGLPSINLGDYHYICKAKDDIAAILEMTDEEKETISESKAEKMLTTLIIRELLS